VCTSRTRWPAGRHDLGDVRRSQAESGGGRNRSQAIVAGDHVTRRPRSSRRSGRFGHEAAARPCHRHPPACRSRVTLAITLRGAAQTIGGLAVVLAAFAMPIALSRIRTRLRVRGRPGQPHERQGEGRRHAEANDQIDLFMSSLLFSAGPGIIRHAAVRRRRSRSSPRSSGKGASTVDTGLSATGFGRMLQRCEFATVSRPA